MDRHEIFADDVQLRFGQQVMDVGDPAGDGVLDRDHRQIRFALSKRVERILEGGARQGSRSGNMSRQAMSEFAPNSP
jgi:hypothetical protein